MCCNNMFKAYVAIRVVICTKVYVTTCLAIRTRSVSVFKISAFKIFTHFARFCDDAWSFETNSFGRTWVAKSRTCSRELCANPKKRGWAVKFLNFNAALFFIMRAKFYAPEFYAPEFLAPWFSLLEFSALWSSPPELCEAEFLKLYFLILEFSVAEAFAPAFLPLEFSSIKFILCRILNLDYAPYYFITSSRVIYVKFHLLKIWTQNSTCEISIKFCY